MKEIMLVTLLIVVLIFGILNISIGENNGQIRNTDTKSTDF